MPVPNYSVLKGRPRSGKVVVGNSPHYQITIDGAGGPFTAAVNIQSVDGSEVLYVVDHAFVVPDPQGLASLPTGMTPLASEWGGLALDFVRETIAGSPMVERASMNLLPVQFPAGHRHNNLNNEIVDLITRTIADPDGSVYVFGSAFSDQGRVDGIHNIHMNQGNPIGSHNQDNGIWQDGGMFVSLPAQNAWLAVFIAFQTESWNTDDSGNPLPVQSVGPLEIPLDM